MGKIEGIIDIGPKNITDFEGKKKIGFKLGGEWYNIFDKEETLKEVMKSLTTGNEISFEFDSVKGVSEIKILSVATPKPTSQGDQKHWAEDITNFETLLNDLF